MACHTALHTASAASSKSHPTVHQDPAGEGMMARVNTRTSGPDGTGMWKWVGVAVVAAVVAIVHGYAQ